MEIRPTPLAAWQLATSAHEIPSVAVPPRRGAVGRSHAAVHGGDLRSVHDDGHGLREGHASLHPALIASEPATQWTINWGDGKIDTLQGNPSQATHAYTTGQVVRNISATAVINGQTVVANTSDEGKDLGAFGQIPSGAEMTFGPDITGDGASDMYVMVWNPNSPTPYLAAYDGMTGTHIKDLCPLVYGNKDLQVGPDGDLYWVRLDTPSVQRYDFATNSVSTFVPSGSGGLTSPGPWRSATMPTATARRSLRR